MTHAEILAQIQAYQRGELSPPEMAGFQVHLSHCAACRELVGHWPTAQPRPGLTGRVMTRLREPDRPGVLGGWSLRTAWAGAALALALLVAAFWHPERKWLNADRSFAFFEPGPRHAALNPFKENRHE